MQQNIFVSFFLPSFLAAVANITVSMFIRKGNFVIYAISSFLSTGTSLMHHVWNKVMG